MASISFDGHSFTLDGRRIWLVGGVVDYARVPAELWKQRLAAVAQAGVNCVTTTVPWNLHEATAGVFRFTGQANVKQLIHLAGQHGLYAILRIGPFVDGGWDGGGIPAWLSQGRAIKPDSPSAQAGPAVKLRQADPVFLQATARYIEAVMEQVRDLQVTATQPGPIVAVQIEHEWFCHNPDEAERYLEQVTRYLRESGCRVPLINTNNLWQQVPGTIDGWNGDTHLFANCRQLGVLQDDAPTIVTSLPAGRCTVWGHQPRPGKSADELLRHMVEVSAAGAMFNLDPLCGGTNFGFYGGRLMGGDDRFVTASHDCQAPLSETGQRTDKYLAVKRLATFLSQFGDVVSHCTPPQPQTVSGSNLSVVQLSGSMGCVVFVMRDSADDAATRTVELITPDGQSLPVDMGRDIAAWTLIDASLAGAARLDLTNLRPWAIIGRRLLVLFGPAGSDAIFSIDGTVRHATVPTGSEPTIVRHDAMVVAICSSEQIDAACLDGERLIVGVEGLDEEGQPIPRRGFKECFYISADGTVDRHKLKAPPKPTAPRLGTWQSVRLDDYTTGEAPRFATLDGPRSLEACGADFGYGWYRIQLSKKPTGKVSLLAPESGDRLHVYQGGKLKGIVGVGAGASVDPLNVTLSGGDLVVLADNLGRFSQGLRLNEAKGLYGHLLDVKALKLSKPLATSEPRVDPFKLSAFVPEAAVDERGPYPRFHFDVKLTSVATPLVLRLHGERPRCVVLVNGEPAGLDSGKGVTISFVLKGEQLKRGNNRITLAMIDRPDRAHDPRSTTELYQVKRVITDKAGWWYARWQLPDAAEYQPAGKASKGAGPAFYRTTFKVTDRSRPLVLELSGVSKGQIYLNGHNLGRYFLATAAGKAVGPQKRYYLPEPWLHTGQENELVMFDEHGNSPASCKLAYEA